MDNDKKSAARGRLLSCLLVSLFTLLIGYAAAGLASGLA
jgi:hypothetical protein